MNDLSVEQREQAWDQKIHVASLTDAQLAYVAYANFGTLEGWLSWAGWGFPVSKIPQVEAEWYAKCSRQQSALELLRQRKIR